VLEYVVDWKAVQWTVEKLVIPLVIPVLVYLYAKKQLVVKRQVEFRERQLTEFYAAMLALRKRIQSHMGFSEELRSAHGEAWLDVVQEHAADDDATVWNDTVATYKNSVDIGNEAWLARLPLYLEMRRLFIEKYAYADKDVREYFTVVDTFVEGLERYQDTRRNSTAAPEAVKRLIKPGTLEPLYDLLERRVDEIQQQILKG